jgi:hypothetical protein
MPRKRRPPAPLGKTAVAYYTRPCGGDKDARGGLSLIRVGPRA